LAQYPSYTRLLTTAGFIPDDLLKLLEKFGDLMEKKILAGPFCSELVMTALRSSGGLISPCDQQVESETLNPCDLEDLAGWNEEEVIISASSADELPGEPVNEGFNNEIHSILSLPVHINQGFASKIRFVKTLFDEILSSIGKVNDGTDGWTAAPRTAAEVREAYLKALSDIDLYMQTICDPFWTWIEGANLCFGKCPEGRKRAGHKIRLDEPTLSERLRMPSYRVVERWDGERCPDIRSCKLVSPGWDDFRRKTTPPVP